MAAKTDGPVSGHELIGCKLDEPLHLEGRPSATDSGSGSERRLRGRLVKVKRSPEAIADFVQEIATRI
jgi:hypothetical protein